MFKKILFCLFLFLVSNCSHKSESQLITEAQEAYAKISQCYRALLLNWMHDDFILGHAHSLTSYNNGELDHAMLPLGGVNKQVRSKITRPVHEYIERMSLDIQNLDRQQENLARRHLQSCPIYKKINKLKMELIRIRTLIRRSAIYKQEK